MTDGSPDAFLPLTTVSFEILLALADGPRHGYDVMVAIEERTSGRISLNPGTLYRALDRLAAPGPARGWRAPRWHEQPQGVQTVAARGPSRGGRSATARRSGQRRPGSASASPGWRPLMRWQRFLACAVRLYAALLVLCPASVPCRLWRRHDGALPAPGASARAGDTVVRRSSPAAWPAWPISSRSGSRAAWRVFARRAVPFPVIPRPEVIPCSPKP